MRLRCSSGRGAALSNPWFRLYAEFLTDPVIRMLAPADRAVFIDVLCMKCAGVLDKSYVTPALRNAIIERYVGISNYPDEQLGKSQLEVTKGRLISQGLIDEQWQPLNWEKRQFQKDARDPTGADRQRRYRERQAEKKLKTSRNVTVTSTDTDTDTEQIQKKNPRTLGTSPRVVVTGLDENSWERWFGYRQDIRKPIKPASILAAQRELAGFGSEQAAVVQHSIANGYQGLFAPSARTAAARAPVRSLEEVEAAEKARATG